MEILGCSVSFLSGCYYLNCDAGSLLAYLDPGSGAMIFQMIIASIAGTAVAIKLFWRNILGIFRSGKAKAQPENKQDVGK